ncbi:hypothetical protein FYJ27_03365 [Anaerosalibacter bizertensis]|uniref:Uncharacterized protein n=3 Tax=Anaerosalibacter bizertensis TaxID=932217 RepID=A0A844FFP8_9FIRM|nr:hypothetical protein [Anaerosalibacter bizertensis]MBU5293587.1 hypothetical protein [Anaerosalibacter bizertensis]MSS42772.1 hypothetical protein [Anaerosalibacter bizertensis]HHV26292.1 hypothetical protein [Tissierellia bacterium]
MKKKKYLFLILGLIIIIFVSSCTSKNSIVSKEDSSEKTKEELKESKKEKQEKVMIEFKALISENKEPYQVIEFIDENIEKVSKKESVEMLEDFEKLQESYIDLYTDELSKENRQNILSQTYSNSEIDPNKIEEIKDDELKELVSKIVKGRYKLVEKEGSYCPVINYVSFKDYEKFLSDELKEYLNIKIIESEAPAILDGKIAITWDELGSRLIRIEKYLTKYEEGIKDEELTRLYSEYLLMYISGSKNTPIYNDENKKISKEILDAYKKMASNNKKTITGEIIREYSQLIEDNDYLVDDTVTSRLLEVYNEAIGRLEENK